MSVLTRTAPWPVPGSVSAFGAALAPGGLSSGLFFPEAPRSCRRATAWATASPAAVFRFARECVARTRHRDSGRRPLRAGSTGAESLRVQARIVRSAGASPVARGRSSTIDSRLLEPSRTATAAQSGPERRRGRRWRTSSPSDPRARGRAPRYRVVAERSGHRLRWSVPCGRSCRSTRSTVRAPSRARAAR